MYREGLTKAADYILGPPKRPGKEVIAPDDERNWEPVPGKPDLAVNKVTGKMRCTPKDPTEWPFPTLPMPAPLPVVEDDQGIDFPQLQPA